ncbi:MAG: penicillin-binding protein activator LpoB [Planctomycetota bacterium]|jgi:uncharacterized protein (TIGR02722 family)
MKRTILYLMVVMGVLITGCTPKTKNIDIRNDEGKPVMGLDYRDFDQAASELVQSMLASGALNKEGGGRYVVAVSRIVNDTMQRIDTDQLMAKIETEILNSGQAVVTSAVGPGSDAMVHDARELRDSEEFDESTVAERGTLIAPELSIAGKIYQSNVTYDKKQQQVEFYIQLMISDVKTGLRYWQNEVIVGKRGSNKSVSW